MLRHAPFITDSGSAQTVCDGITGKEIAYRPRYDVWTFDSDRQRMQVKEVHDLLAYLQIKHSVPDKRVFPLGRDDPSAPSRSDSESADTPSLGQ